MLDLFFCKNCWSACIPLTFLLIHKDWLVRHGWRVEWLERKRSMLFPHPWPRGGFLSLSLCSVLLRKKAFNTKRMDEWEEDREKK